MMDVDTRHPYLRKMEQAADFVEQRTAEYEKAKRENEELKKSYEERGEKTSKTKKMYGEYGPTVQRYNRDIREARSKQAEAKKRLEVAKLNLQRLTLQYDLRGERDDDVRYEAQRIGGSYVYMSQPDWDVRTIVLDWEKKIEEEIEFAEGISQQVSDLTQLAQDAGIELNQDELDAFKHLVRGMAPIFRTAQESLNRVKK